MYCLEESRKKCIDMQESYKDGIILQDSCKKYVFGQILQDSCKKCIFAQTAFLHNLLHRRYDLQVLIYWVFGNSKSLYLRLYSSKFGTIWYICYNK